MVTRSRRGSGRRGSEQPVWRVTSKQTPPAKEQAVATHKEQAVMARSVLTSRQTPPFAGKKWVKSSFRRKDWSHLAAIPFACPRGRAAVSDAVRAGGGLESM